MKKVSRWFKRLNIDHELRSKTHKVYKGPSIYQEDIKRLASTGAGTVCFKLEKYQAFNLDLIATNAFLRIMINEDSIRLYCIYRGRFIILKEDNSRGIGLEVDPECLYWLSYQAKNRSIMFGKHDPNSENITFSFTLPKSNKSTEQYWMNKISHYRIDTPAVIYLSKHIVKKEAAKKPSINLLHTRA